MCSHRHIPDTGGLAAPAVHDGHRPKFPPMQMYTIAPLPLYCRTLSHTLLIINLLPLHLRKWPRDRVASNGQASLLPSIVQLLLGCLHLSMRSRPVPRPQSSLVYIDNLIARCYHFPDKQLAPAVNDGGCPKFLVRGCGRGVFRHFRCGGGVIAGDPLLAQGGYYYSGKLGATIVSAVFIAVHRSIAAWMPSSVVPIRY